MGKVRGLWPHVYWLVNWSTGLLRVFRGLWPPSWLPRAAPPRPRRDLAGFRALKCAVWSWEGVGRAASICLTVVAVFFLGGSCHQFVSQSSPWCTLRCVTQSLRVTSMLALWQLKGLNVSRMLVVASRSEVPRLSHSLGLPFNPVKRDVSRSTSVASWTCTAKPRA